MSRVKCVGINYWSKVVSSRKRDPLGKIKVHTTHYHGKVRLFADENAFGFEIGDYIRQISLRSLPNYMGRNGYELIVFERKEV